MQDMIKPQLDKANEVLQGLAVNVTTDDRKKAIETLNVHEVTVRRYLKGQGTDLDTAAKFIKFFKKMIAERYKVIAA